MVTGVTCYELERASGSTIITFFTVLTADNSRLCELRIDYLIEDG